MLATCALLAFAPTIAARECPWQLGIGTPGLNGNVLALAHFDDGSGKGAALFAGGEFTQAGGVAAPFLAKWDGNAWQSIGGDLNAPVHALLSFDDGSGPALYVGGQFTQVGGQPAKGIARWNGKDWQPVGGGMAGAIGHAVNALASFDDGSGTEPALYAGGDFTMAGENPVFFIARWDGKIWSQVAGGFDDAVNALAVCDTGGKPQLYATGNFTTCDPGGEELGASRIARFDGSKWTKLESGIQGIGRALCSSGSDGGKQGGGLGVHALYVGGHFTQVNGLGEAAVIANGIARWDGGKWSALGEGLGGVPAPSVHAMVIFDDQSGGGPALYAGGSFAAAGGVPAANIAKWNGKEWLAVNLGVSAAVLAMAAALPVDKNANPEKLYVAGAFHTAGGAGGADAVGRIAALPVCPPARRVGDLNADEHVNVDDLLMLLIAWGPCALMAGVACAADIAPPPPSGGDGVVNVDDLLALLADWG